MIPKEKAYDLMIKYFKLSYCNDTRERHYNAKDCALIAVDEILKIINLEFTDNCETVDIFLYWQKVKREIEAL